MNGVGLTTVGRLLGHRQRQTTATYAHLDDGALRDSAAQAAAVIARAMGLRADAPAMPDEAEHGDVSRLWSNAQSLEGRRPRPRGSGLPHGSDPQNPSGRIGSGKAARRHLPDALP